MRKLSSLVLIAILGLTLSALAEVAEEQKEETAPESRALFNGKDFTGWKLFIPEANVDPATVWSVGEGGVVRCTGTPSGYMRTTEMYENFKLSFEWRWSGDSGGNSGLLLHITGEDKVWPKSIEGQMMSENAGDFWCIDGTDFAEHTDKSDRRVPKRKDHNEKPIGEWNKYDAICVGDTIHLFINGMLQNVATSTSVGKGYIGLQSEGTPIEFRNIVLGPLPANPHSENGEGKRCGLNGEKRACCTMDGAAREDKTN